MILSFRFPRSQIRGTDLVAILRFKGDENRMMSFFHTFPFRHFSASGCEDTLRRIWAFNRVPGARQVIEDFILQQGILET